MTRRGSFGPVVLLGVGAAGLAAVAGNKPWTDVYDAGGDCGGMYAADLAGLDLAKEAPLAGALALLALAAWGVILVTRSRTRRVLGVVAALASAGFLAATFEARTSLKEAVLREVEQRFGEPPAGCSAAAVHMNDWWPAALAAGVLALGAAVLAVVLAPHWPEMGSKYDAPSAGGRPAAVPLEEQSSTDLWKSLDAGHDPTIESGTDPEPDGDPRA